MNLSRDESAIILDAMREHVYAQGRPANPAQRQVLEIAWDRRDRFPLTLRGEILAALYTAEKEYPATEVPTVRALIVHLKGYLPVVE